MIFNGKARTIFIGNTTIGKTVFFGTRPSQRGAGITLADMVVPLKVLGEMILSLEAILAPVLLTMRARVTLSIRSMTETVSSHDVDAREGGTTIILRT